MSDNSLEMVKKSIKRKRGDLIDLDYFALANKMMSEEVFSEEKHIQIKRNRSSDAGKMDELLDFIDESSSEETLKSFMNAVEKQNKSLAEKIKQGYEFNCNEEESQEIFVASDIFSQSQPDDDDVEIISQVQHRAENEANILRSKNRDGETSIVSSTTIATDPSNSSNSLDDYIPSETQVFQFESNCTEFPEKTYTMKEVHEKLNTAFSYCKFRIETCWIKGFETMVYRKGEDMVYKGCPYVGLGPHNNQPCLNGVTKVKVNDKTDSGSTEDFYECKAKHRTNGYENVARLRHVQLEDSTGYVKEVTMFAENAERFLNMKADEMLKLDENGIKKVVDKTRSFLYTVILQCTPRNRYSHSSSQVQVTGCPSSPFVWDFKASISGRRIVAPELRVNYYR